MAKRSEADMGSLSFGDRSLSITAASELLNTKSGNTLGCIIDTAVVRIKDAKTTKAERLTDAHFSTRYEATANGRNAKTERYLTAPSGIWRKPRELA